MRKKELLLKQANELYKRVKLLEAQESQKIGKAALELYEKRELKDKFLASEIAKILGDNETENPAEIKPEEI
jgi:hypothetical protein